MIDESAIKSRLDDYQDPVLGCDLKSARVVRGLTLDGDQVRVAIRTGFPLDNYADTLRQSLGEYLAEAFPGLTFTIDLDWKVEPHVRGSQTEALKGVRNIIAVASGKGGVGKSTTSVNLALALQAEGARVGILDADIYGPSQPIMLGAAGEQPASNDRKSLEPVISHGIQSMSIGYLVDPDQAMVWRGPMASGALQQLINDTRWQDLDYLIVDLPPGTGDIQLTLAQKVPITAAVVVTTPQDIALSDARKAVAMFDKVKVPVLGIIENMAVHICSNCGHAEHIFGSGGGEFLAEKYGVPLLGSLPLALQIREQTDSGRPTVIADPEGDITRTYLDIARRTAARLSLQARDHGAIFPKISIENT